MKPIYIRSELLKRNIRFFTPEEFGRIFDVSKLKIKYLLETYAKNGLFLRLKQGLYTLKDDRPNEEEIANILYRPSYISFEYALAYHNIIPEMVYALTSATTKPTRVFEVENQVFVYQKIKKQAFTGYQLIKQDERTILIAEPEKALVDYLYFVSLGKKQKNERWHITHLNKSKAIKYAKLYERESLIDLVKETI